MGIKKFGLDKDRVGMHISLAFILASLFLAISLLHVERGFGGTNFLYRHGLPHFYLIEDSSSESMSYINELMVSKNIFMKNDWREILNGIIPLYLMVNFLFWFSVSFFLLGFVDGLKRMNSNK